MKSLPRYWRLFGFLSLFMAQAGIIHAAPAPTFGTVQGWVHVKDSDGNYLSNVQVAVNLTKDGSAPYTKMYDTGNPGGPILVNITDVLANTTRGITAIACGKSVSSASFVVLPNPQFTNFGDLTLTCPAVPAGGGVGILKL